jgi:hypothetical protein
MNFINVAKLICFIYKPNQATIGKDTSETLAVALNFINIDKLICFAYKPNYETIGKDTSETLAPAGGVLCILFRKRC